MTETQQFNYPLMGISLDYDVLFKMLGSGEGDIKEHLQIEIDSIYARLSEELLIKGGYVIYQDIEFLNDYTICIEDQIFSVGKIVYNMLKKAEGIAVFACTAGPSIEILSKKLRTEGDIMGEYVVNAMGSLIVETAMDVVHQNLADSAKESSHRITNRYSPGYCNWDVSEQQKLFNLLPEKFCNIALTESSLMQPIKSVSGFIGIGPEVRFNNYTCDICSAKECIYRNIRATKKKS